MFELYSMGVRAVTAFVILVAVYTVSRNAQLEVQGFLGPHKDDPEIHEQRFHAVKAALPSVQSVGYISNCGSPGTGPRRAAVALKEYFLVRYVLAPVRVIYGIDDEYIVGNFSCAGDVTNDEDLLVVHDFGNRVVLFRRERR